MKKLVRFSLAALSALPILLPSSASASSHYGTFGGVLTGGVGDWGNNRQYYYIDSSASGEATKIDDSMYAWVHTGNIVSTPISFRGTTNKPSSVIDIYKGYYFSPDQGTIAITRFYRYGGEIDPSNNYSWTKIQLNTPVYDGLSSFDESGSIAHEMGHAFGLAHDNYEADIMCQLDSGVPGEAKRTVNTPDRGSLYGINSLY